ncbi:MAG: HU family DNA-binding protein [Firmicutes bacterium]|nr:HU family DNA-binding protein [Bacillota bacterium]
MRKKSEALLGTAEIYRAVAERKGFIKRDTRQALDAFAEVLTEALAEGRTVRYSGLGTFRPVTRKRRGKNATYVTVRFRPARRLLATLNKTEEADQDA